MKALVFSVLSSVPLSFTLVAAAQKLPPDPLPFAGHVAMTAKASVPAWPQRPRPPAGAPNIVVILLDDVGFEAISAGQVPEAARPYPGYNSHWGADTASVADVLRQHGYHPAGFGKWHNTPSLETGVMGPFDRWPGGLGFEYFYGVPRR